jgi:hypothetical protein
LKLRISHQLGLNQAPQKTRLLSVGSVLRPRSDLVLTHREGISALIVQDALPGIKRFLKPTGLNKRSLGLVVRCVAAFCLHWGRMSAGPAAGAVRSEPRPRTPITRFLGRNYLRTRPLLSVVPTRVLALEPLGGRSVYLTDQTLCSQQGDKTENTYRTGNRQRRPRKGRRSSKYKHARKRGHCFVRGLLITPAAFAFRFAAATTPRSIARRRVVFTASKRIWR